MSELWPPFEEQKGDVVVSDASKRFDALAFNVFKDVLVMTVTPPVMWDEVELEEEPELLCPECWSYDVEEFFDPDTSWKGEMQYRCRDCEHEW